MDTATELDFDELLYLCQGHETELNECIFKALTHTVNAGFRGISCGQKKKIKLKFPD